MLTLTKRLQTSEATYLRLREIRTVVDWHFAIDCKCGGKSGSHTKNTEESMREITKYYEPFKPATKYKHTFYVNEYTFLIILNMHDSRRDDKPFLIACNDCKQEFSFTPESYNNLASKINREGETEHSIDEPI